MKRLETEGRTLYGSAVAFQNKKNILTRVQEAERSISNAVSNSRDYPDRPRVVRSGKVKEKKREKNKRYNVWEKTSRENEKITLVASELKKIRVDRVGSYRCSSRSRYYVYEGWHT